MAVGEQEGALTADDDAVDTCLPGSSLVWTPIFGRELQPTMELTSLPAGNLSVRAVVESSEVGTQTCVHASLPIYALEVSINETAVRSAIEGGMNALLSDAAHRALPQAMAAGVSSLANALNGQPLNTTNATEGGEWRSSMREAMLSMLESNTASSIAPSWRKLQHAQAVSATVASPTEMTDGGAIAGLMLVRNTTSSLLQADAFSGIQDSLLGALGELASSDTVFSPPPLREARERQR